MGTMLKHSDNILHSLMYNSFTSSATEIPDTEFVCLFELVLNVPVNSYGHVGTLSPF